MSGNTNSGSYCFEMPTCYLWMEIGMLAQAMAANSMLKFVEAMQHHDQLWLIFFSACATQLWQIRNSRTFDGVKLPIRTIKRQIADNLRPWIVRINKEAVHLRLAQWADNLT